MKTLILFASMHGCTETVVNQLQKGLPGEVKILNLKDRTPVFINAFDIILIGGSIHAGRIQRSVKKFCTKNLDLLLQKKLGLFLCYMDQDLAEEQFENAFSFELREHAFTKGLLGGAFFFEKMNFIQKTIIKKISGTDSSVNKLDENAIQEFIISIKKEMTLN